MGQELRRRGDATRRMQLGRGKEKDIERMRGRATEPTKGKDDSRPCSRGSSAKWPEIMVAHGEKVSPPYRGSPVRVHLREISVETRHGGKDTTVFRLCYAPLCDRPFPRNVQRAGQATTTRRDATPPSSVENTGLGFSLVSREIKYPPCDSIVSSFARHTAAELLLQPLSRG